MTVTIWHNPRCTKSREALKLLQSKGIEPEVFLYLKTPPTTAQILAAQKALGLPVIEMMRIKEPQFRALGLTRDDNETALIAAMAEHPVMIERPIVFSGDKARIGRPTEAVLDIL